MGFTGFLIAIALVCFLLILAIMVQNPKGGGLSSTFGSSQQMGGVQKTTDFLDKSTWILATALLALILVSNVAIDSGNTASESKALDADNTTIPAPKSTTPATNDSSTPQTQED